MSLPVKWLRIRRNSRDRLRGEEGITLMELIVATAILTVVTAIGALILQQSIALTQLGQNRWAVQNGTSSALTVVAAEFRKASGVSVTGGNSITNVTLQRPAGEVITFTLNGGDLSRRINGGSPWIFAQDISQFVVTQETTGNYLLTVTASSGDETKTMSARVKPRLP